MRQIDTILIANRGEIASRIIRTCRRLGVRAVAVYSEADRHMPFVQAADEALLIGEAPATASYLDQEKIIAAAHRSRADAIHPGYGFLSENAAFARRCAREGFVFIGPNPLAIEKMGSKSAAKEIMIAHHVPVIPGYQGADQSLERIRKESEQIGFPILLKATAGGGGKGMRVVHSLDELAEKYEAVRREAKHAFGIDDLLVEKYFPSARHIEFQIFGDHHGKVVHLLDRECSLQRRHQKIMEESPAPALDDATRSKMGKAAILAAKAIEYDNAGTVEFLYTNTGAFYFLEMNTRLQVEHPVTECITGLDLVEMQIRVAEGTPLMIEQNSIQANGYALECRLYAEDARNGFLPVSGTIHEWNIPELEGLRVDSAITGGSSIGIHYDPMIAKLIAHGSNRSQAIRRMRYALERLVCLGITTNLPFLLRLLAQPEVQAGHYDTHYVEERLDRSDLYDYPEEIHHRAAIAITLFRWQQRHKEQVLLKTLPSGWRNNHYQHQEEHYRIIERDWKIRYRYNKGTFEFHIDDHYYKVLLLDAYARGVRFEVNGYQVDYPIACKEDWYFLHCPGIGQLIARTLPRFPEVESQVSPGDYASPMPGEVLRIMAQPGAKIKTGDSLLVLSSMKMENIITANEDGTVEAIYVVEGQQVEAGLLLLKIAGETI